MSCCGNRSLATVTNGDSCSAQRTLIAMRAVECAELLALAVFNRANGQPISMSVVQHRLEQL